ncbi:hypothetical protein COP2_032739 [Malus domestica]
MEIPFFTLLFFLILSIFLITPEFTSLQTQFPPSNKQGKNKLQVSFPTLLRKLRLTGKVTVAEHIKWRRPKTQFKTTHFRRWCSGSALY